MSVSVDVMEISMIRWKRFVEYCCFFCIGCFFGDLNIVKILLKYINKKVINFNEIEIL